MELTYGILTLILLAGISWGGIAYITRDKSKDAASERATKRVMDDPGPEPMKGDHPQQPGGVPSKSYWPKASG
jgi:hypothetical protein